MGRNIKIELELPEFEKELNISVTLRKDGEVLLCTSSTPAEIKTNINENPTSLPFPGQPDNSPVWKQNPTCGGPGSRVNLGNEKSTGNNVGGNMMDINF